MVLLSERNGNGNGMRDREDEVEANVEEWKIWPAIDNSMSFSYKSSIYIN